MRARSVDSPCACWVLRTKGSLAHEQTRSTSGIASWSSSAGSDQNKSPRCSDTINGMAAKQFSTSAEA